MAIPAWLKFASDVALPILGLTGSSRDRDNRNDASQQQFDAEMAAIASNEGIAGANLEAQIAWQQQQMEWAQELRRQELQGNTNQFGDRMSFVDGQGWLTDLSPGSQNVADAGRRQDVLNRTVVDADNRERQGRLADTQRQESGIAGDLLREYQGINPVSGSQLAATQFAASTADRNAILDSVNNQAAQTSQRMHGSSNLGSVLAAQAGQSADALQGDFGDALLTKLTGGQSGAINAQNRDNVAGQYNNFRDKSVQAWNPNFQPVSNPSFNSGSTAGSNAAFGNAFSGGAPQQPYVPTNYAEANRASANASADSSFYSDLLKGLQIGGDIFGGFGGSDPAPSRQLGNNSGSTSYNPYGSRQGTNASGLFDEGF